MTFSRSLRVARGKWLLGGLLCVSLGLAPAAEAQTAETGQMPITTSSKEARAVFEQGRDKFDNVETAAAAPLFDQAIEKDAGFAMAYAYRALSGGGVAVFRKNLDKAVALADKVSEGERHWIMAVKAQADGQSAEQKQQVDRLVALFPSDKRVQQLAGTYYFFVASDEAKALEHFTKATRLDPKFAAAYNMTGYVQVARNEYPAAEQAFKTYITLRPSSPNPYDSYAELLMKMGKFDDSIAQYRKALEVDPSFTASLAGIGDNQVFKGNFAKARETYEEQFSKASGINARIGALNGIVMAYVHEGDTAGALKALDRVRTLAEKEGQVPSVIGTHDDAAAILLEAGKAGEAAAHAAKADQVREASSLPAPVKEGRRIVTTLIEARILAEQKTVEAARAEIAKVKGDIDRRKNAFEERFLHETLGLLDLAEGNAAGALTHLASADSNDPYVLYYEAVAQEKKGDSAAATKLYRRVADWNSNGLRYALVRAKAIEKIKKT